MAEEITVKERIAFLKGKVCQESHDKLVNLVENLRIYKNKKEDYPPKKLEESIRGFERSAESFYQEAQELEEEYLGIEDLELCGHFSEFKKLYSGLVEYIQEQRGKEQKDKKQTEAENSA